MSTNKKLIILSVALLLCITIGGTLAFTASIEDDTNVLSTGRVDIEQLGYEREKDAKRNVSPARISSQLVYVCDTKNPQSQK